MIHITNGTFDFRQKCGTSTNAMRGFIMKSRAQNSRKALWPWKWCNTTMTTEVQIVLEIPDAAKINKTVHMV